MRTGNDHAPPSPIPRFALLGIEPGKNGKDRKRAKGQAGRKDGGQFLANCLFECKFFFVVSFRAPFSFPNSRLLSNVCQSRKGKKGEIASPGVLGHRTKAAAIEKKGRKFQEGQPSAKLTSYFFLCSVSFAVSSSSDSLEI